MMRLEDALFNRRGSYQKSRNKNPWLDKIVITACYKGMTEINEALSYYSESEFQKYANVKTEKQKTALHQAAEYHQYDLIKLFLEKGACVHSTDEDNYAALQVCLLSAYEDDKKLQAVAILLNKGSNIDCRTAKGDSVLHIAAEMNLEEIVKILLEKNANPFLANQNNQTAVDLALNHNRIPIVALLLKFMKASIDSDIYKKIYINDVKKWLATKEARLFEAIDSNNIIEVKNLLTPGLFSNKPINTFHITQADTSLHRAVAKGQIEIIRLLIENKARINAINSCCETPLHIAVRAGYAEIVLLLLVNGASLAVYDDNDQLPIDIANAQKHSDIIESYKKFTKPNHHFTRGTEGSSLNYEKAHLKLFNILQTENVLTELVLQEKIDDYYAEMMVRGLKKVNSLTKIDLSNNLLGNRAAIFIAELIKHNPFLTYLDLSHNQIKRKGINAIINSLWDNKVLTYLNLSDGQLSAESIEGLVNFFKSEYCCLEQLDVSQSGLSDEDGFVLINALQTNYTLRILNLSNNQLGYKSIQALSSMLSHNKTLMRLNLSNNYIGGEAAQILAEALKMNSVLNELNLNDNDIRIEGIRALASAMRSGCALTELYVSHNNIWGSESFDTIAELVKSNTPLSKLEIYGGTQGDWMVLADALVKNKILTQITFSSLPGFIPYHEVRSYQEFSSKENQDFASILLQNNSMLYIDLNGQHWGYMSEHNLALCRELLDAAKQGDTNKVVTLLEDGVSPLAMPKDENNMAIHWAAQNGHAEVVKLLSQEMMRRNISPAVPNRNLKSAFELAKLNGNLEAVEILQFFEKFFYENFMQKTLLHTLNQALNEPEKKQSADVQSQCNLIEEKANQGHQEIALKYAIWLNKNKELKIFSQEKCVHYLALATRGSDSNMSQKAFNELSQFYPVDIFKELATVDIEIPKTISETTKPLAISHLLRKADERLVDENFSEAVQHYNSVLEIDAKNAYALVRKGMALQKLNQLEEAKRTYQMATSIEDKKAEKYLQQAKQKLEEIEKRLALQQTIVTPSISSQDAEREELLGKGTVPFSQNRARYQFCQRTSSRQTHTNNSTSQKSTKGSITWRK